MKGRVTFPAQIVVGKAGISGARDVRRSHGSDVGARHEPVGPEIEAMMVDSLVEPVADLETIAHHEAGHAVMRWLRGLPATGLLADHEGGFCAGTNDPIEAKDYLLVTLAGFVSETGCFYSEFDLVSLTNSKGDDFDQARRIIDGTPWLRIVVKDGQPYETQSVDEALVAHFTHAGDLLWPHHELVERVAERLAAEGHLTARTVAALCREYSKRMKGGA